MNLVLTSAGLKNKKVAEKFLKILPNKPENVKVLMITFAQSDEEESYVNESKQELIDLGLKNITIANMHRDIMIDTFNDFNVIYVCGGNTFSILQKLRETKLNKFIIEQVKKGTIYVGVSAGSIIAGKNIEIASWGSEGDKNEINLKDLKGLSLTDVTIFPHFKQELRTEVEKFRNKVKYPVIELTDEQAMFIINGNKQIIQ